jgi:hypothetical protein
VLDYSQARKLSEEYSRRYKPGQKPAYWVGPSTSYTRLRRKDPAREAIITGHVDEREEDGTLRPMPGAFISIGKISIRESHTFADEQGNYVRTLTPGRYPMRVGGIGLLWSEAPPLQVQMGDSIRANFQLLFDLRPLID